MPQLGDVTSFTLIACFSLTNTIESDFTRIAHIFFGEKLRI